MKKSLLLIAVLALVPAFMFAELGIGGAAMLTSPGLLGQTVDSDRLNVNQFNFGGDIRVKEGMIQIQSLIFCSAGEVSGLDLYLDAGIAFDITLIRLSAGLGPNITWNFGETPVLQAGMNAKLGMDLMLNNVSVGMSYLMAMKHNEHMSVNTAAGLLGFNVIFWM